MKRNRNNIKSKNYRDGVKDNSFKKTVNRDVTREDRLPAADRMRDGKYATKVGDNDPAWYSGDAALKRDSARMYWSYVTGNSATLRGSTSQGMDMNFVVPGVCTLQLIPTCGSAFNQNSAVNVAAQAIYSYVRYANSGSRNYDNPDLMLYILAMTNVYSAISWAERVYGTSRLYAMSNRYLPDALLQSQGVQPLDSAGSLADFRYGINVLINKASSFAVPSTFPIFKRHAFIFQNVYQDGVSDKTQLYQYVPFGFYQYGLDSDGAGQLTFKALPTELMTFNDILSYISSLLQPLLGAEDIGIMSGDILKAYGTGGIIQLQAMEDNYYVTPLYNMEVLEQFKNARGIDFGHLDIASLSINQGTLKQYITFAPTVNVTPAEAVAVSKAATMDITMTTQLVEPTQDTIMVNTRLVTYLAPEAPNEWSVVAGTELVGSSRYYVWNYANNIRTLTSYRFGGWTAVTEQTTRSAMLNWFQILSYFDMHPFVGFVLLDTAGTLNGVYTAFDLDNWGIITTQDIRFLHETAILSEFKVDSVAKAYTP